MSQPAHTDSREARQDLDRLLRQVVIVGTIAVLLIPAARGSTQLLGWLLRHEMLQ